MAPNLSTHKPWEHWLAMTLGLLIGISPWLAQSLDSPFVVLNAVVAGIQHREENKGRFP